MTMYINNSHLILLNMQKKIFITIFFFFFLSAVIAQPRFHALVLFENGGHHLAFTNAAQPWLNKLAADSNFSITYIQKTDSINEVFLSKYQLFIQLDYPPYSWTTAAMDAFKNYIEKRQRWLDRFTSCHTVG